MTSIETKLEKNYLQCSICCDQFVNPRVLNCQHSFCHKCLEGCFKASKNNSIKCAICRKKTLMPRKGLREIPQNFMIVSLLQMLKDSQHGSKKNNADKPTTSKKAATPKTKAAASKAKATKASVSVKSKTQPKAKPTHVAPKKAQLKAKDVNDNRSVQAIKTKPEKKAAIKVAAGCCKEKNSRKPCQKSKCFKKNVQLEESFSSSESSNDELTPDSDSSGSSNSDSYTDSDSSDFDSDSGGSDDSSYTDSSYEVLSENDGRQFDSDDDESYSDDDSPPTPHLQSFMGINVKSKVLVFTEKGKICKGVVRVLEKFKRKPLCLSAVYAGVELLEGKSVQENADLNRDMQDSYLYSWIKTYDKLCTVVRADQCCPTSFYDSVAPK